MAVDIKKQMLKFKKQLTGLVEDSTSKEVMTEVGEEAVRLIKQQARIGKDYKTGQKFKPLSEEYIEKRDEYSDYLDETARKSKSNVTATGQMVDSVKVTKVGPKTVEVAATGTRSASPFGGGNISNAEVAFYVESQGRHWLGLSKKSKARIENFYKRIVNGLIRKSRKT